MSDGADCLVQSDATVAEQRKGRKMRSIDIWHTESSSVLWCGYLEWSHTPQGMMWGVWVPKEPLPYASTVAPTFLGYHDTESDGLETAYEHFGFDR